MATCDPSMPLCVLPGGALEQNEAYDPSAVPGQQTGKQVPWGANTKRVGGKPIVGGRDTDGPYTLGGTVQSTPVYKDADSVVGYMAQLRLQNPAEYAAYVNRFYAQGLIGANPSTDDVDKAWARAVGLSADLHAGGVDVAPWDAIDLMKDNTAEQEGPFTGTRNVATSSYDVNNSTRRKVDLSSASEARAFLLAAAENELGRAATADEIAAFRAALNAEEKANAEVTKARTVTKGSGSDKQTYVDGVQTASASSSSSSSDTDETTTGGMDRGQYAIDYARSADDYAEYTAATTFMNTLFSALQSTAEVGTN